MTRGRPKQIDEGEKERRRLEGKRLQALREAAGVTQEEAAGRIEVKANQLSRKERGRAPFSRAERLALEAFYRGQRPGGSGTTEPAASGTGGLSQPRSMDFWEGRQSALLDMMQFAADLQRQAADWQGRSIEAQREIIAATTPRPRQMTEAELARAEGVLEGQRLKRERAAAAERRGGRAG